MNNKPFDFAIIGGGLIGLATAKALRQRDQHLRIAIFEKEKQLGQHQSGRNSGVIHSGIYYKAGSLKSRLTAKGRQAMFEFCAQRDIPVEACGKVVLAQSADELPRLYALHENAKGIGLDAEIIDQKTLSEIEPFARAEAAIWLPGTAIVDYSRVVQALAEELLDKGVALFMGQRVAQISSHGGSHKIDAGLEMVDAKFVINCGGLHSDQIAKLMGIEVRARIIPFRGQYFRLKEAARKMVRGLIYPLPDPKFPFLGVHLTRTISGEVLAGPNAVLSLKREGYQRGDVDLRDALSTLLYPGFWRFGLDNMRIGMGELLRAWNSNAFARSLQKMLPALAPDDFEVGRAGVRAQAVSRAGKLLNDFQFERGAQSLHVINAPSPGATASLAIGQHIAAEAFALLY